MTQTLPDTPPGTVPWSCPRPGWDDEATRCVALMFAAEGATGDLFRRGAHPQDGLFLRLADEIDRLNAGLVPAERTSPEACRG